MKPTLCSRCKKNVAVVFITRLDPNGQNSHNEGLCLKCARELNIRPVTDMIEKMGLSDEELTHFMIYEAKVWLDEGYLFGEHGRGYERFNLACPRSVVKECIDRIADAARRRGLTGGMGK